MMINKRLIGVVKESKRYIFKNVIFQWISLLANIVMMGTIAYLLQMLYLGTLQSTSFYLSVGIVLAVLLVRFVCTILSSRMSYLSSKTVKKRFREMIYRKLLSLGTSYKEQIQTSEVIQVAVEGVEQLETYFGSYLPQFFYAMLAPITLFVVISFVNVPAAVILLVCVPLIPITIAAIQTWAKKLLGKYWTQYTSLGDTFLENLQGLTTTKIYQADVYKHQQMNEQSEAFRKVTMKVLTMQLNSITVMDLIAYGGAALGVIIAITQWDAGRVDLMGCLLIILLAADFFLPMRMLGSFFHIAMNGMAASDKIFRLLDLEEPKEKVENVPADCTISVTDLSFSYNQNPESDQKVLQNVSMTFPMGSFTAIVGESGCGKSTFASILMGKNETIQKYGFLTFVFNSFIVIGFAMIAQVILCSVCAYVISKKLSKRAGNLVLLFFLGGMMIPFASIMLPQLIMYKDMGAYNNYWALLLPFLYPFGFYVYLYKGFFDQIPSSYFEAAELDGAGSFYLYSKICMPLSKPIISLIALQTFIGNWNDFFWAWLVTEDQNLWTLNVALYNISNNVATKQNAIMGLSVVTITPVILLSLLFSKQLKQSIMASGVKG